MRWSIGFGAERLGLIALAFPRRAAVCLLGLLILIGSALPRLSFDDDIHRVFLSDSALSHAQRAYEAQQAPPLSTALIHVTSQDAFGASDLTLLRDLALDLEFVDGVTAVASPFVLRWPPGENAPTGTPVFSAQITPNFADDLARFEALGTGLPIFVNGTHTAMLLSVSLNKDETDIAAAMAGIGAVLTRALPAHLTAHVTGEDVISAEIVTGLKGDLIALNLWGALIVTLAAFALLRDLRMALLAVVPALFGAAGVLALSVWLGYPITVLSNVIPILLLVLGVADGVHLAGHLKAGGTCGQAVASVGPACALTALTTAAAFASIMLTGNAQLFEFAVLGALGSVVSFAIVIVTFALLGTQLTTMPRPIPPISAVLAQRLTRVGMARPVLVIAVCIGILGTAGFGFAQTKAWFPLYQNLPDDSATVAVNDAISEDFGGVFQMVVEAHGEWDEFRRLVQAIEAAAAPRSVLSELNFARWLGAPDTPPAPEDVQNLPQTMLDLLRSKDQTRRIVIWVPEPMRSEDALAQFDKVHDTAIAAGAQRVIGLPTVMRVEAVNLIEQLSFGLIIAALGATALVALAFRSARLVPVLLIPNVLPLMITGASLHLWAQGQLSPTAVLALTIAFGIAIDDTVHFLSRFADARRAGQSAAEAVTAASRSAGQVLVLTTLLLTLGLAVTLLSGFTPIRLFGSMMIVTLWAALLIDLLLLPALLTWKRTADVFS